MHRSAQAPRLQPRSGLLRPYRLLVTSPVASTPPGKTQAPAEKKGNAGKEKKEKKEESFYSATVKLPETGTTKYYLEVIFLLTRTRT